MLATSYYVSVLEGERVGDLDISLVEEEEKYVPYFYFIFPMGETRVCV
jgi:hypothetical protein